MASRSSSPGNWLAEILAIIKADENFSPPGQIINEAKKPSLFMSNQFRYGPDQTRQLVDIVKSPPKGTYKGPLMDIVLTDLKKLKKYKPGAERKYMRNAIIQDFRMAELNSQQGTVDSLMRNMKKTGKQHAKYGGKFVDSMRNLSKSRSLLGLGALAGVGIMAMGNIGNEA
jgi:hypothetical protein